MRLLLMEISLAWLAACAPFADATESPSPADAGDAGGARCASLELDGSETYVEVRDHADLDPSGASTIEAWVRVERDDVDEMHIVSHHDHGANTGYLLMIFGKGATAGDPAQLGASVRYYHGAGFTQAGYGQPSQVPMGTWTHVAAVYDGASLRIYVDGSLRETKVAALPNADFVGPLRIGRSAVGGAFPFRGRIAEVRLSSTARYGTETFSPERRFDVDPDTIALYRLDEGAGDEATDGTGRHHGTIHGGAWADDCPGR